MLNIMWDTEKLLRTGMVKKKSISRIHFCQYVCPVPMDLSNKHRYSTISPLSPELD